MNEGELRKFILDTKIAVSLQGVRISINNKIYSNLVETYIRQHQNYPKLLLLRRDKTMDRKEVEKYKKKLLKESLERNNIAMEDFSKEFIRQKEVSPIYKDLLKLENMAFNNLKDGYNKFAVHQWLDEVKGIGLRYGSQLIATIIDITRFSNPSKLRTFMGCAPGQRKSRGQEANFNPKNKGLALGKIGKALMMSRGKYKKVYDEAKEKLKLERPELFNNPKKLPAYPHKWARKKMVQRFLLDLYIAWHKSLGLEPPTKPYSSRYHPYEEYKPVVAWKEEWKIQIEIDAKTKINVSYKNNENYVKVVN